MKKSYYMMMDVNEKDSEVYFDVPDYSDICGWIESYVRMGSRDIKNIRLFRFSTKKAWEDSRRANLTYVS